MKPPTERPVRDGSSREHRLQGLKAKLHEQLVNSVDIAVLRTVDPSVLRDELRCGAERLCSAHADLLSQADRSRLIDELVDETLGLGPLEPLMHDPCIFSVVVVC